MKKAERAVLTVIGVDRTGIIAKLSNTLYENEVNIIDIQQNIQQDLFTMIMMVDVSGSKVSFEALTEAVTKDGEELGVKVLLMHEDIFNAMHRI
jgi:ACT domain-containing protein